MDNFLNQIMEWLPHLKIYLGKRHIFTEEEFELLNNFKHDYKKPSPIELLETFPEAAPIIQRNYKILKNKRQKAEEICGKYLSKVYKILRAETAGIPKETTNEMEKYLDKVFYYYRMEKYNHRVLQLNQLLKIMDWKRKPKNLKNITNQDITMAKQIPLSNFLETNRAGFSICPFHNDIHPSCKVYTKENRFHCFSCGADGDVIDFISKTSGLNFINSVKKLLNK